MFRIGLFMIVVFILGLGCFLALMLHAFYSSEQIHEDVWHEMSDLDKKGWKNR